METPQYKLLKPFYADDTLFPEGAVVSFLGTPNEQMEPLNEPAKQKFAEFIKRVEDGAAAAGRISRKLEDIVQQEVMNRPREQPRVSVPQYNPEVPAMGNINVHGDQKKAPAEMKTKLISTPVTPPQKPIAIGEAKV